MSPTPSTSILTTTTSEITPSATNSSTNNGDGSSGVVTEVIVGGVVAGVLLALVIIGIVLFLYQEYTRRRRNKVINRGSASKSIASRGRSVEGSDPLLYPTISQVGQGEFNPYTESVSLSARPVRLDLSLNHSEIDILEPLASSSSMMLETPKPLSPARPSLSPLVIPHSAAVPSSATIPIQPHPTTTAAVTTAVADDKNHDPPSAVSVDDTASDSSLSAYSQASASTRRYKVWEDDTHFPPPIPEIPSRYLSSANPASSQSTDETTSLTRGNTAKLSALLQYRARRAQRGKPIPLSRSSTKVSRIERDDSLETITFNPPSGSGSGHSLRRDTSTQPEGTKSPAPSESASLTIRNPFVDASSSSRSTSVTTSIANHAAQTVDPPYAHRLSVIDNEEAETQSVYADEVVPVEGMLLPNTLPLRITKNQAPVVQASMAREGQRDARPERCEAREMRGQRDARPVLSDAVVRRLPEIFIFFIVILIASKPCTSTINNPCSASLNCSHFVTQNQSSSPADE
ncbi:hypothetical protein EV360DRAFT_67691 [Lentinula raphanica]|nr:hypothetical protein EV360DRAFT_67691 [Lentinula raphanica]